MTVIADDHMSRPDGSATGGAEGARGIVVGSSEGVAGCVDGGWTVLDVLQERLGRWGFQSSEASTSAMTWSDWMRRPTTPSCSARRPPSTPEPGR